MCRSPASKSTSLFSLLVGLVRTRDDEHFAQVSAATPRSPEKRRSNNDFRANPDRASSLVRRIQSWPCGSGDRHVERWFSLPRHQGCNHENRVGMFRAIINNKAPPPGAAAPAPAQKVHSRHHVDP
jgi:hypothetical protein